MAFRAQNISGAFEKRVPEMKNKLKVFLLAMHAYVIAFKKTIEAWALFLELLCNQTVNSKQTTKHAPPPISVTHAFVVFSFMKGVMMYEGCKLFTEKINLDRNQCRVNCF